jgi:hypothetical protein
VVALLTSLPGSLLDVRRPRVESAPPYAYSLAEEAVELSRLAGLQLDDWQQRALELMLAVRPDGKWACFEYGEIVARQNGKGSILEARALAGLILLGEQLIMWSAHEYKTAMEGFRRFRTLLQTIGEPVAENRIDIEGVPVKVSNTNGEESFERLDTGQRVKFIARSKGSGRGFSGDVNIIDEAYAYTPDQHAALMPTMSARANPQIIYTSSPPLDGASGEVLYGLRERAEAGGDDSLGWRDWGADGDLDHLEKLDLNDRDLWLATNPAMPERITEETVQRERRSLGALEFARERLCVWPKRRIGGGAIEMAQWAKLLDGTSKRDGDITLAVDIAPQRDYAAIGLYGPRADGLGHWQLVDYRPGTEWLLDRIVELRAGLDPIAIALGRATAASLEVELEKHDIHRPVKPDEPVRGDLAVLTAAEMTAATGQALDVVRQAAVRHIGQQPLDAAVAGAKTRETGDSVAWSRKDADADISPLVSVSLARWAYEARAHLVVAAQYDVLDSVY